MLHMQLSPDVWEQRGSHSTSSTKNHNGHHQLSVDLLQMAALQARTQVTNPQAVKTCRRLYVGGIPGDVSEVRMAGARCRALSTAANTFAPVSTRGAAWP